MNPFAQYWSLDPNIIFLNHGSFGACPLPVLAKQQQLRSQLEAEPLRFFEREYEPLLDAARQTLAQFVGTNAAQLVFVPNATTGVNTVLRSIAPHFKPGDELLTTSHEYNATRNALNFVATLTGATVTVADIPFPIASAQQITDCVLAQVTDRTRLVVIDHITSQTGLVFPVQVIATQLTRRGIDLLIDGAHAPGMIPLNLDELGVAYYTGNCHKWLCAPKGAGFLYVRPDKQAQIRPLVISHGANSPRVDRSPFHLEFDWTGTGDPTPYLCVPAALDFMRSLLPGGWAQVMTQNRELVLQARTHLCQTLEIPAPCPADLIGSMAVLPLPAGSVASNNTAESLKTALFHEFHLEVPIIPWQGCSNRLVRISAQLYNSIADYDVLARTLVNLLVEQSGEGKKGGKTE